MLILQFTLLAIMALVSFVAMYILMYAMVNKLADVYFVALKKMLVAPAITLLPDFHYQPSAICGVVF